MKKLNRWVYAAFGVVILLFAGMVYAWSVLSGPIAQEYPQWTNAQLSLTFTIVMTLFCVGCMAGGFLSGKVSAKIYVWAAAAMFLGGFMLSARITSLMGLYIGFGVICGFASGLAYNAVMGTISRWFPDKQGLISGVLLMGFGLSSFLVGKIFQMCTPRPSVRGVSPSPCSVSSPPWCWPSAPSSWKSLPRTTSPPPPASRPSAG